MKMNVKSMLSVCKWRNARKKPRQSSSYLDSSEHGIFVNIMISSVHDALGLWPAELSSPNGSPEHSFTAATGVAVRAFSTHFKNGTVPRHTRKDEKTR